jgi:hypothetical protein
MGVRKEKKKIQNHECFFICARNFVSRAQDPKI